MAGYSPNPIPDKHADWGKDVTDNLKRPFSGRRVQDFIKAMFDTKVGYLHPDAANENYLLFADAESYAEYIEDPIGKADLLIGTVPLASNYYVEIDLENTNVINYINHGETGNYIQAYFKVKNKGGAEIADDFKLTITIRNGSASTILHRSATYGTLFSLNIDEYLLEGTNVITIAAASVTYGVGTSLSITYHSIILKVSDTFDISTVYNNETPNLRIQVNVEGSGTKILQWKIDNESQLPYDSGDQVDLQEGTVDKYINISSLSEGRHTLQYRAVRDINGINFYSDTMYRDFIVYRGVAYNTIIATAFSYRANDFINPTANPISLGHVEQYMSKIIKYAMYNPNNVAINTITITLGDNAEQFNIQEGIVYDYDLKSFNSGNTALVFSLNGTTLNFNAIIDTSTLSLVTIGNTEFEFSGNARANTSLDKELHDWSFTGVGGSTYRATMAGFAYTDRNGWTKDGLLIGEGASLSFNYKPLNYNLLTYGGTFEFEFETKRVLADDQVICDLRNNGIGLVITASEAKLQWAGEDLSVKYKSEERNRITFVINPLQNNVNHGLAFIFVNGILSGVKNYAVSASFTSNKDLIFTGSANAQILLKQVRVYPRALTLDEVLNNYILYRPTIEELLESYDNNDIIESGTTLSVNKLSGKTPIIIITGDVEKLQNFTSADKKTYVRMDKIEVINMEDPSRNMTLINPSMRCQGTSSMNYPKKNFRFYTQADNKDEQRERDYVTQMFDADGNEITGSDRLYSFKDGAQPVKTWCLKADYAESSSTHNTGTARLWNTVMKNVKITAANMNPNYYNQNTEYPCRTRAQQAAIDNEYPYDVRTTVDGFPIVLFFHRTESDPLVFLGKYNWNNDKSTESVFGFRDIPGFDNSHMECWEIINGDHPENLFTDISQWEATTEGRGWRNAFESRYPDDAGEASEAQRAEGVNSALKAFATWVNSTKDATHIVDGHLVPNTEYQSQITSFSTGKWQHLDIYKIAAYYVYLMRFGAVDQTVKNAMLTTEDGQHFYFINYDNDTILGLDNTGALKFDYTIDRQTPNPESPSTYCYAGHASVLWNNLECDAEFMEIVKQVDQALYDAGLTYANVVAMYNEQQSSKWSERLHNLDSQFKYLGPFLNGVYAAGLPKLQGSRDTHRQWWLSNRFARFDAINVVGSYQANNITIIPNGTIHIDPAKIVVVVPSVTGQIYGYGKDKTPVVAGVVGTKDVPISMELSGDFYIGEYPRFYNMVFVKKIDLSSMSEYIQQINLENINTAAFNSSLEEIWLGIYGNNGVGGSAANNSMNQLANLGKAKYLKVLNVCNYNALGSIDLSENAYLEEFDGRGCQNLAFVTLPDSAPLKVLNFPASLKTLSLREINTLTTLNLNGAIPDNIILKSSDVTGFTDSPSALYAWKAARISNNIDTECNIDIDNIQWDNVSVSDIISFGQYVKQNGYLALRGTARLQSGLTLEQVSQLREVFGQNCFDADASLRFIGAGIFFVGPEEVLSDGSYDYSIINATGHILTVQFSVSGVAGTTFVQTGSNLRVTIPEVTAADGTLTLTAVASDESTGDISTNSKSVIVKKRIYPSSANSTITGEARVQGNQSYVWSDSTEGINTQDKYYILWTITGDIAQKVEIKSGAAQDTCVVGIKSGQTIDEEYTGMIVVTIKKISNDSTVATKSMNITAFSNSIAFTRTSNSELMDIMYNNYHVDGVTRLAANQNYMTKVECALVTNEDLYKNLSPSINNSIFYGKNLYNLEEFKWFTGLTEIPEYTFEDTRLYGTIIIPEGVNYIRNRAFGRSSSSSMRTKPTTIIINNPNGVIIQGRQQFGVENTNPNYNIKFIGKVLIDLGYNENTKELTLCNDFEFSYLEFINYSTNNYSLNNKSLTIYVSDNSNSKINYIKNPEVVFSNVNTIYTAITNVNIKINSMELSNDNLLPFLGYSYSDNTTGIIEIDNTNFVPWGYSRNIKINSNVNIIFGGTVLSTYYDLSHKLYLLSNITVPQTCNLIDSNLTGKCIVVSHDMLQAFKTAFPTIADHFTDGFTPEGNMLDFTVTGDDVIGQAIGTILHVRKQYNGTYADETSGTDWVEEDMEQEDNFFQQNENNVTVPRIFNVTINGVTKSCTINQGVIDNENIIEIKTKAITLNSSSVYKQRNTGDFNSLYINNKKKIVTINSNLIKTNGILNENDNVIIKLNQTLNSLQSSFINNNVVNYIKEIDLSKIIITNNFNFNGALYGTQALKVTIGQLKTNTSVSTMFRYSSSIQEIICLSTIIPSDGWNMLSDISSANGVFKYPFDVDYSTIIAKLPSGWTTQVIYPPYLTFKSANSFTLAISNSTKNWDGTLQYSTDKETWTTWDGTTPLSAVVDNGNYYIYLRGSNNTYLTGTDAAHQYRHFALTGTDIECNGDIRTLLDYEDTENTVMSSGCFASLFYNCTALISPPDLPATVLAQSCYSAMFYNCSLTTAPELPATTLAQSCYTSMFEYCNSLTIPPKLPATILVDSCYHYMFINCTNLTKTPILKATTLANNCYKEMFSHCRNLNEVTLDYNAAFDSSKAQNWLNDVATTGIFKKNPNLTIETGTSGIPSGWTVEDADPPYLEFKSVNSFTLETLSKNKQWSGILEYSTDLLTWNTWIGNQINSVSDGTNHKIYLRGKNNTQINSNSSGKAKFILTGTDIECNGDIRTLLDYEDPENTTIGEYCFAYQFMNCTELISAPKLLAKTLNTRCYESMFQGCTKLTTAPDIFATTLASYCCQAMFHSCTNLVTAPKELLAITGASYCYSSMFYGCTSLIESPIIYTTINSYSYGVSNMFNGCSSLNKITVLSDYIDVDSASNWVRNVASSGNFYRKPYSSSVNINNALVPSNWTINVIN